MAEHQLRSIGEEAAREFALKEVMIQHRLGFVATGEASLFLRVCSRRRAAAFRASGLNFPNITVSTITPELRISLLATGRFLTIFPTSVLEFSAKRADIKVLPIQLPMARVSLGLVTLRGRTLDPVARLFIEHAREVAKPLAKAK